ncbi:glycosyl transferase [Betaproteobacteria bacterium]|nr:glycosyl transferase [Betaproteobacteria bacterium]GHU18077.1 glycosyl transferase [Betaproteobacteria bacterium]
MADTRAPLLYLTHRIPYPPNKGDKVRSFNILRQLARTHRVLLGTFIDQPGDAQHVDTLRQWCEAVYAVRLHPRWQKLASLRGLLGGEALSLPYYRDRRLARWVSAVVARERIQAGVVFSGPMAQYFELPGLDRLSRKIVDFCDVDSAKWTQYAAGRHGPLAWLYRREGEKLLAFERRAAANSDASLFVTAAEAALFQASAPDAARLGVMQNGVDADYFSPAHVLPDPYPPGGPVLVFTGAMDYWPNIDAVSAFVADVLPLIRRRRPDVRFWIVGMNPAPAVGALAGEGVVVTGSVPDVRPYLAHATVVVAPLRIARGIQNKVLEAMAMARPVVVASAAAAGLAARAGEECEIVDNAEFACATLRLLDDEAMRVQMGQQARHGVVERHSWRSHLAVLDHLLE